MYRRVSLITDSAGFMFHDDLRWQDQYSALARNASPSIAMIERFYAFRLEDGCGRTAQEKDLGFGCVTDKSRIRAL
jgi:hypothetical protein